MGLKPYKLNLRKSEDKVLLCEEGYTYISGQSYLKHLRFTERIRKHSKGYPVFQRQLNTDNGKVVETIYLHKTLAQEFVPKPETEKNLYACFKNKNPLDCRIENLEWLTRSEMRQRSVKKIKPTENSNVFKDGDFYQVVFNHKGRSYHLGPFESIKEAAEAYETKMKSLT